MKENDLFLNILDNPEFSLSDFQTIGFTADNTGVESKDYYKNNSFVQEKFTNNGRFDEVAFNKAYETAQVAYNLLASQDYEEAMIKQASFSRDNILAPALQRRQEPDFKLITVPNPMKQQTGIVTLGKTEAPKLSIEEIAQTQKVRDLETNTWHDSPNESFFTDFFETRVLAQWNEDGYHDDPITKERVEHKKGDLKLNENGTYYYENLGNRDVYGKIVLNKMNTLTVDGSALNDYDFFDSDDIQQKSIGGSIMKNLALVGSMFIPGVGPWITGISIATQAAGFLSTLGKMFIGSDSPVLSSIEGWAKSVDRQTAKTDYAKNNVLCWENFINLIGDVTAQLKEQRFIFKEVPALFKGNIGKSNKLQQQTIQEWAAKYEKEELKNLDELVAIKNAKIADSGLSINKIKALSEIKTNSIVKAQKDMELYMKDYNKIGEVLSKTYMTAITVEDTYGEAKLAGASDLEATMLTLGYAAGEYWILNTGIGEHILPELKDEGFRSKAIAKALTKDVRKDLETINSKEEKISFIKNLFNKGKNIAILDYTKGTRILPSMFAHGIGEGVEEVSEEFLADFSKSVFNVLGWLRGDDTRLHAWENMTERYGMSFFGGIIGGAINAPSIDYKLNEKYINMTPEAAMQELIFKIRNGQADEFLKTVNKLTLGDKNLSMYSTVENEQGQTIAAAASNYEDSQDFALKKSINEQVKFIQDILNSEGANISDASFLNKQSLGYLREQSLQKSITSGRYLQEFNSLGSNLVRNIVALNQFIQTDLQNRAERSREENGEQTAQDIVRQTEREKLEEAINENKKSIKDLLEGKRAAEFLEDVLFEMTAGLNNTFTKPTFIQYAEWVEKKKIKDISPERLETLKEQYSNWKNTDAKDQIHFMARIYRDMAQKSSQLITDQYNDLIKNKDYFDPFFKFAQAINNYYSIGINSEDILNFAQNLYSNYLQVAELFNESYDQNTVQSNLERVKEELQNATDETEKQKLLDEYKEYIDDMIYTYIEDMYYKLEAQGYVNSEIKGQLNFLIDSLNNVYNIKSNDASEDEEDILINKISNLNTIKEKLNQLNSSPIEELLNQFSLLVTSDSIDFKTLVNRIQNIIESKRSDISEFNLEEKLIDEINEALNIIDLYQAAINGAKVDNIGLNTQLTSRGLLEDSSDLWGYNKTLNEINKKQNTEDWKELAEIDTQTANIILQDSTLLKNKLEFLKRLYYINQGQKLVQQDKVALNEYYILYNKLSKFSVYIPDDWEGKQDFLSVLESLESFKEHAKDKHFNLTEEQKKQLEKEKIQFEDAIYELFNKNLTEEKLIKFINSDVFQLFHKPTELLDENLDDLDDNSFIWYLASRVAVKSSSFYSKFKNIINDEVAPIPTQELAVYINYASILNGNVFTKFYNVYRQSVKNKWKSLSKDDRKTLIPNIGDKYYEDNYVDFIYSLSVSPIFQNIVLTEGIPGSGKTTAVYNYTIKMLQETYPDLLKNVFISHGANKTSGDKLKTDLNLESAKVYSKQDLLKLISNKYHEYTISDDGKIDIPESDLYVDNGEVKLSLPINSVSDIPSLIIIDEISKFNSLELNLLDEFAKKYGITILVAGDFDQSGANGNFDIKINNIEEKIALSNSRQSFIRSPKLGVSMRTANSQKTYNLKQLQAILQNGVEGQIDLRYYEDETGLYGDKVYNKHDDKIINFDKLKEDIDLLLRTSTEKIGFIYYSKDTELYKYLSQPQFADKIEFFAEGTAQGLEGEYYIIENDPNSRIYFKDLYTGVTRSEKGSLVVAPFNNKKISSINSTSQPSTMLEGISKESIKNYSQRRKKSLDELISSNDTIQFNPRNTGTQQQQVQRTGGLENGVSIDKQQQNNNSQQSNNDTQQGNNPPQQENNPPQQGNNTQQQDLPITNTDIINKDDFKSQIDNSSSGDSIDEIITSEQLSIILHSFNTFETGVTLDKNGNIDINKLTPFRIDSINGLLKIDQLKGINQRKYSEYVNILGNIRSLILSKTSKSDIINVLQTALGLDNLYLTFAFKSSAPIAAAKEGYERFFKNLSEKLSFINSVDQHSKDINLKSLVAIIGNNENGDLLEIPLFTLTSPLTLLKLKKDGKYVFDEVYKVYKETQGTTISKIDEVIKQFDGNSNYQNLVNLFKLYRFTYNGIFYIEDNNWTPAGNLESLGPQFVSSKGQMQEQSGYNYTSYWLPINQFALDPSLNVSPILTSKYSTVSGYNKPIVQAGHPFILISNDKTITDLGDYYVRQFTENLPKKVKLVYVLPPQASVETYIKNLYKLINQKGIGYKRIGNEFTSYKLLNILLNDNEFNNYFDSKFRTLLTIARTKIQEVNNAATQEEKVKLLLSQSDWSSVGIPNNYTLTQQLDGLLKTLVYQPSIITQDSLGQIHVGNIQLTFNQEALNKISEILHNNKVDGVYYQAQLPASENQIMHGPFYQIVQESGWKIDGQDFNINGKVDSCAFRGDFSELIENWLSKIENSTENENGPKKSKDNDKYLSGNSNLNNTENDPNQYIYDLLKLKGLEDIYDKDKSIDDIIRSVNRTHKYLAFTYNGQFYITPKNDIFNCDLFVSIHEEQDLTKSLSDIKTSKKYKLRKYNLDNDIEYELELIDTGSGLELKLTEIPKNNQPQNNQIIELNVDENNLDSYKDVFNDEIFIKIKSRSKKPTTVNTLEDFISILNKIKSNEKLSKKYIDALQEKIKEYDENSNGWNIIQNLLQYFSDIQQTQEICPITITIKI